MFSRISPLVMWLLIALPVLACGESGSPTPAVPAGAPIPTKPAVTASPTIVPFSDWQAELRPLEPSAVCNTISRQDLEPYEQFVTYVGDADEVMANGWSFRGQPPLRLEPPIDWELLASEDRSWNFALNEWRPIDSVLTAHTQSSNPQYLSLALAFASDWIIKNPYSPPEVDAGVEDFGWYDMAVGRRSYRTAYILDAACRDSSATPEQIGQIWGSLLDHFDYLSDDANIAFQSNHGLYQATGQFAAATRFVGFTPIAQFRLQAMRRLNHLVDKHFSSEGVHLEHSPDYHRNLVKLFEGIAPLGLANEFPSLAARIEESEDVLAWMILPNRRLANLGDTDYRDLSKGAIKDSQSPLLRYALSSGHEGSATSQRMGIFPESGLAVLRSGWPDAEHYDRASYLAQQAGFHSRTHKQADDLSFIWYDRGTEILIDAGRYGYLGRTETGSGLWNQGFWYSDPRRIYVESTRSHNTVEIDGMSYDRRQSSPYGSAIRRWGETVDGLMFVETEAPQFESISHSRLLVLNPGKWLFVYDRLWDDAQEDHDYRQWFHFAPDLTVERGDGMLHVSGESLDTDLTVVSLLPSAEPSAPVFGQEHPDLLGWWSEKGGVFEPTTSANFSIKGERSAVFVTLFSFSEGATPDLDYQEVDASGRNGKFRWSATGQRHTLSFQRPTEGDLAVEYSVEPVR